jgi:hypothetical protein
MKPHKHKDLIIAWANGALIEYRHGNVWLSTASPWWEDGMDYRIKPTPDFVSYTFIDIYGVSPYTKERVGIDNVRLTFDGETGKLKAAEVLNG